MGYVNSKFGGYFDTLMSVTALVLMLAGSLISESSKPQQTVRLFLGEAENTKQMYLVSMPSPCKNFGLERKSSQLMSHLTPICFSCYPCSASSNS